MSQNKYAFYEWATAGMLSLGISLFLFAQGMYETFHLPYPSTTSYTQINVGVCAIDAFLP